MKTVINFIEKRKFWQLLLIFVLLPAIVFFRDYFFMKYVFYFSDIGSDTINLFFPQLTHNAFVEKESFWHWWSFYIGIGQIFPTILLLEPGSIIFNHYIFFWPEAWKYTFHIIYFGEILLAATAIFYYFRTIGTQKTAAIAAAVFWAFSGYMIVGAQWYVFPYYILGATLLMLGIEKILHKQNPIWFVLGVYILSYTLYYVLTYAIFAGFYLIIRLIEEQYDFKRIKKILAKITVLSLLGIIANLVNIIPRWMQIIFSPRVSGDASLMHKLISNPEPIGTASRIGTTIARFFGNDIPGFATNFQGWYNYLEAPLFYVGLLSLLLIPQFFVLANKRKKITRAIFLGFWLLVAFVPVLRHAINLFAGNYFRITIDFFVGFSLLITAIEAFDLILRKQTLNIKILAVTTTVLIVLLWLSPQIGGFEGNGYLMKTTTILLLAEAYLLYMLTTEQSKTGLILLLILIPLEAGYISHFSLTERGKYTTVEFEKTRGGYYDNSIEALNFIKQNDTSKFYRVEKDYSSGTAIHASLNDNMVQNYFSTVSYNSFNQLNYIRFLEAIGVVKKGNETQTRWAHGVRNLPLMMSLTGVKYFMTKNPQTKLRYTGFDSVATFGDVMLLENKYALPLGFFTDKVLSEKDFYGLNNFKRQVALLSAAIVDTTAERTLSQFAGLDTAQLPSEREFNFDIYGKLIDSLDRYHFEVTGFTNSALKAKINNNKPGILIFSIPFDQGWTITDNGKKAEKFRTDIGLTGINLEPGTHIIELKYKTPFYYQSLIISLLGLIFILLFFGVFYKKTKQWIQ